MTFPEFPKTAQVHVCDLIRTTNLHGDPEVVFAVKPEIQAGRVISDDEGEIERIGFPGTYSGPLKVLGRLAAEQLLEGFVDKNFPKEVAVEIKQMWRQELQVQAEYGAVEIENY